MTSRERFLRTMAGEPVDRPPLWSEGIREDVRAEWAKAGYPLDRDLDADFSIEPREQIQPETLHRDFRMVDRDSDSEELDLAAADPARYPDDWDDLIRKCRDRDFTAGLRVSRGIFQILGVGSWASLSPLLIAIADEPDRVRKVMDDWARFALRVLERAFDEIDFDYMLFSEPIASNSAPVIGPRAFARTCGEAYTRILRYARRRGVRWAVFQSYGHLTPLIGEAMRMGMDAYWGGDVAPARTPYPELRRKFGRELALIGGIDAGLLEEDTRTLETEIRRLVTPLVADGRYIPLLDGRVRSYVPFQRYRAYRRTLVAVIDSIAEDGGTRL